MQLRNGKQYIGYYLNLKHTRVCNWAFLELLDLLGCESRSNNKYNTYIIKDDMYSKNGNITFDIDTNNDADYFIDIKNNILEFYCNDIISIRLNSKQIIAIQNWLKKFGYTI